VLIVQVFFQNTVFESIILAGASIAAIAGLLLSLIRNDA
jgi:hypothetical protein